VRLGRIGVTHCCSSPGSEEQGWCDAIGAFCNTFAAHRAVAAALHTNAEVKALWSDVLEGIVTDGTAAIEAERRRGAAPDGIPARDLAISLNWMVERVLFSMLAGRLARAERLRLWRVSGMRVRPRKQRILIAL